MALHQTISESSWLHTYCIGKRFCMLERGNVTPMTWEQSLPATTLAIHFMECTDLKPVLAVGLSIIAVPGITQSKKTFIETLETGKWFCRNANEGLESFENLNDCSKDAV